MVFLYFQMLTSHLAIVLLKVVPLKCVILIKGIFLFRYDDLVDNSNLVLVRFSKPREDKNGDGGM